MQRAAGSRSTGRNLLLAFDAFGTLFKPRAPIATQYAEVARLHGIQGIRNEDVQSGFRQAFGEISQAYPNYGREVGLGAPRWWGKIIDRTFQDILGEEKEVPRELIHDLLTRFSSSEGYTIYPDVLQFFRSLRESNWKTDGQPQSNSSDVWPWDKTLVGIITNSDDRVSKILSSFGLKIGPRRIGSMTKPNDHLLRDEDIHFVALSYDIGHEKPDSRVFDAARDLYEATIKDGSESQLNRYDLLYVGDDIERDYFGAKNAGWNAIHIDRSRIFNSLDLDRSNIHTVSVPNETGKDANASREISVIRDLSALRNWSPKS